MLGAFLKEIYQILYNWINFVSVSWKGVHIYLIIYNFENILNYYFIFKNFCT